MAMRYSNKFNDKKLIQSFYTKANTLDNGLENSILSSAEKVKQESIANAPVDEHDLENAIDTEIRETRAGHYAIDVGVIGDENEVQEYAYIMHEYLQPYGVGTYNLDKGSQAKDGGSGKVGGKYLQRALDDNKQEVIAAIRDMIKRSI